MKKFQIFIFTALLSFTLTGFLSAFSIGREGSPYVENGINWQGVCYKNNDAGFIASMPGSPTSGISGGDAYSYSNYKDVDYEIHTSLSTRYTPPKKEKDFIKQVQDAFIGEATVVPVSSNQSNVKYIAEIYFNEESKIVRVYCSNNCLYWAIVDGNDLSLAFLFFDMIIITK